MNAAERAYLRTDLFERRRRLMQEWAHFIDPRNAGRADGGEVVPLRKRR
jgi:hypothetical protein